MNTNTQKTCKNFSAAVTPDASQTVFETTTPKTEVAK